MFLLLPVCCGAEAGEAQFTPPGPDLSAERVCPPGVQAASLEPQDQGVQIHSQDLQSLSQLRISTKAEVCVLGYS